MAFSITKKAFGHHFLYELTDTLTKTKVGIIATCGASLNNFLVVANNKTVDVINGYKSSDDLEENVAKNFKGVILSPFANRVNKASYNFNDSNFVLDKVWKDKDYAIHGYLYNQPFEVMDETTSEESATLILKNKSDGAFPGFPFKFETTVIYTLKENNQLSCKTAIQNVGKESMPLSFGWHPLFFNDVNIDAAELQFPTKYKIGVDDNFIPDGNNTPYNEFNSAKIIGDTFFDTCFKLKDAENGFSKVKITEPSKNIQIELSIETGKNKVEFLQIYIPPQRNTIAIEPMTSSPDAFNNKNGLITLKPQEQIDLTYEITIKV